MCKFCTLLTGRPSKIGNKGNSMLVSELISLLSTMRQDAIVVVQGQMAYVEDLQLDGVLETHVCELPGQRAAAWFDPFHGALSFTQCEADEGGVPAVLIG